MAEATGIEVRAKHTSYMAHKDYDGHTGLSCFSPVINIMRHPLWGRNQVSSTSQCIYISACKKYFKYIQTIPILALILSHRKLRSVLKILHNNIDLTPVFGVYLTPVFGVYSLNALKKYQGPGLCYFSSFYLERGKLVRHLATMQFYSAVVFLIWWCLFKDTQMGCVWVVFKKHACCLRLMNSGFCVIWTRINQTTQNGKFVKAALSFR